MVPGLNAPFCAIGNVCIAARKGEKGVAIGCLLWEHSTLRKDLKQFYSCWKLLPPAARRTSWSLPARSCFLWTFVNLMNLRNVLAYEIDADSCSLELETPGFLLFPSSLASSKNTGPGSPHQSQLCSSSNLKQYYTEAESLKDSLWWGWGNNKILSNWRRHKRCSCEHPSW
jgi:hypothetical protein